MRCILCANRFEWNLFYAPTSGVVSQPEVEDYASETDVQCCFIRIGLALLYCTPFIKEVLQSTLTPMASSLH